jgi:hypothetical protein
MYQNAIRTAKQKGGWGTSIAFAAEQTLPIVKIPTNIVRQIFEYQFGTVQGGVKVLKAMEKGLDKLTPQEADVIMRQLKNGSVGMLMFGIGALCADEIGGIYIKDEDKGDNEYGSAFGVPRFLLENPAFACLQVGATVSRYWSNRLPDAETLPEIGMTIATGLALTQLGVIEEAPFVKAMGSLPKIAESGERLPITLAEIYARPYIPNIIQHFANMSDLEEPIDWNSWTNIASSVVAPKATPRAPETVWQSLELAVPALGQPEEYSRLGVPER